MRDISVNTSCSKCPHQVSYNIWFEREKKTMNFKKYCEKCSYHLGRNEAINEMKGLE